MGEIRREDINKGYRVTFRLTNMHICDNSFKSRLCTSDKTYHLNMRNLLNGNYTSVRLLLKKKA